VDTVKRVWEKYLLSIGENPDSTELSYVFADHFCATKEPADALFDLAISGIKRATAGSLWVYEANRDPVLAAGDLWILTDFGKTRACVAKNLRVTVKAFGEITEADAETEGEGDKSLDYWRRVHREYFSRECESIGKVFSESMPVVFEEFKIIFRET
jgi:uncharacterized protein YhfF